MTRDEIVLGVRNIIESVDEDPSLGDAADLVVRFFETKHPLFKAMRKIMADHGVASDIAYECEEQATWDHEEEWQLLAQVVRGDVLP